MVVVDSVAALVPRAELEGDMGDVQPGAQARLMSQALRKLTGAIHKSECVVIFINQTREKIGVMFGSPITTSGGKALKFYASVRLEIARIGAVKKGDEVLGNRTRVKVVKNKVAPPFRRTEFDIYYGEGVCLASELLDLGRQVARLHWRTRGGGEGSPGELPASLRSAGEELAALRESRGESPSSSTPARVHRAEPDGAVPGPGKVTLRASQALERKLGKDLVLELELPASVASVLRAAAEARPSARRLLLTESGGPLPSIHRRGERLSSDSSVRAGDLLDLVLVIPGG